MVPNQSDIVMVVENGVTIWKLLVEDVALEW